MEHKLLQGKTIFKNPFVYGAMALLSSVLFGTIAMILVYALPITPITNHVRETTSFYEKEGDYPLWSISSLGVTIDNFSDAVMLMEASFIGTGDVVDDAMLNYFIHCPDISLTECLIQQVSTDAIEDNVNVEAYGRYWNGYLVYMKPLLLVFSATHLRIINMLLQMTILCWLIIELYKKGGYRLVIPAMTAILAMNPISIALCHHYSVVYVITIITAISILRSKELVEEWKFFLWTGIATAFFSLLTYPLVSMGFNLVIVLFLKNDSLKDQVKRIVSCALAWGTGFAGMWIGKWVIGSFFTGENIIADGVTQLATRTAGMGSDYGGMNLASWFHAIINNVWQLASIPYFLLMLFVVVVMFIYGLKKKTIHFNVKLIGPYVLVMLYPFFWYCIANNYATIHAVFCYRELAVTIMAGMVIWMDICMAPSQEDLLPAAEPATLCKEESTHD